MAVIRPQIRVGMKIVGSDGVEIGEVKEVRDTDFLLHRPLARDLYVPFDAVRSCTDNVCTLNITSGQVDQMGWQSPPAFGG